MKKRCRASHICEQTDDGNTSSSNQSDWSVMSLKGHHSEASTTTPAEHHMSTHPNSRSAIVEVQA